MLYRWSMLVTLPTWNLDIMADLLIFAELDHTRLTPRLLAVQCLHKDSKPVSYRQPLSSSLQASQTCIFHVAKKIISGLLVVETRIALTDIDRGVQTTQSWRTRYKPHLMPYRLHQVHDACDTRDGQ